jgi:predicted MFS family arabinose efflux permease
MNTMHRMVYPFLPVFGRGLGVDLAALSLALTLRALVGVFGPLVGGLADSRGRKAGMMLGLGIFTLGVALVAIWPSYPVFLLTLILALLGKCIFDPSMQAYLGDRVSYQRRGLVLAITELGWSLGFVAGVPAMGLLIARLGWYGPFPVLVVFGALTTGLLAWMLPPDPAPADGRPGIFANFRTVLNYRPALVGLCMGLLLNAGNETVNLVFGVWMEDAFDLKIAALGAASAVIGLSELGGESLVGGLADRLGKPRALTAGLLLNCLAALALPYLGQNLYGALAGLFFFYITFEITLVTSIPLMTEILPSARATLMAGYVATLSLGRALGALVAPSLYGIGLPDFLPALAPNALAAVLFNLLALAALSRLVIGMEKRQVSTTG